MKGTPLNYMYVQSFLIKTLSKLFCVFQICIFRKNGPFRHVFHIDSAKYRAFFQTKWNVGIIAALFKQKTRKFLLFDKSKTLQFSRIKKMCCFKRATFCIIQRKVKRRYNLLVQIFIFLIRCLLNLVKVHIMLCTFKNGTIKSLILTLNMFKRFFFFHFYLTWYQEL